MIKRIVRMTFKEENIDAFIAIFDDAKFKIRAMPGCQYLSLHRDHHQPSVYYTLSHWDSQQSLDDYRHTELFKTTWAATKLLFEERAEAFSLTEIDELK
ncbi:MAG: quinol monooxygenase YgiN [Marinoscillum sp.]|jgi:quinol monooxygenase YgiN